jgi:hypothetical protein
MLARYCLCVDVYHVLMSNDPSLIEVDIYIIFWDNQSSVCWSFYWLIYEKFMKNLARIKMK